MANENCEILFEYLRSILYDSSPTQIDIHSLDPDFQKLGMGLQFLDHAIQEMKQCSTALAKGNLSEFNPSRDNFLCANLKNIHANLEHLTWQAKQVAKGDYSQHVSYMGDFSNSFNQMTEQLKEREEHFKSEAELEKKHAETVNKYNQLLLELIRQSNDDVLITNIDQSTILYSSHNKVRVEQENEILYYFFTQIKQPCGWNMKDKDNRYYHIVTISMEWQDKPSFAHFIHDITQEKKEQDQLHKQAHMDALTQVGNRYYFQDEMQKVLDSKTSATLCYCDLDHLKYVNDNYGHDKGDTYICDFVEILKSNIREDDIIARLGGDEFCILFRNGSIDSINSKMKLINEEFSKQASGYPQSFSFGTVYIDGNKDTSLLKILQTADQRMYVQKRKK